jgi:hypothetical protein
MTVQIEELKKPALFARFVTKSAKDYAGHFVLDFLMMWVSLILSVIIVDQRIFFWRLFSFEYAPYAFFVTVAIWVFFLIFAKVSPAFVHMFFPRNLITPDAGETSEMYLQHLFAEERQLTEPEALLANKLRTIAVIDERIGRLRFRANLMLYAVGALLIGASIIIVFAGTLTNLDASAVSNVDRITKDIADAERRLAQLSGVEELKKTSLTDDSARKKLASLADTDSSLPVSDAGIAAEIEGAKKRLTQSEELLKTAWDKELSAERGYNDTRYIIATAITRVGVVLVIIFLAQVLIGLYRYNTRLITFYNSRRDFFQIWNGKGASPKELQRIIEPHIDFGKEPKHPLDDIIRQVIAKVHPPALSLSEVSGKGKTE